MAKGWQHFTITFHITMLIVPKPLIAGAFIRKKIDGKGTFVSKGSLPVEI